MNNKVKNGNRAFLLAMFLPQIIAILLISLFSNFYDDIEQLSSSYVYLFSMMLVAQVSFAVIYLVSAKKNKINVLQKIKTVPSKLNIENILLCILISIIAVFGLVYFVGLFDKLFELIGYSASSTGIPNNTIGWFAVNVLLSAVVPAILEELLFRSIIFKGMKNHGFWFACIISSAMFMLVHLSLGSIVYPLIMGVVFCLVVRKTGSALYSVIVHFCNNFIVLLVEYLSNVNGKSILPEINLWWQYALAVVGAVVALLIIWFIIKNGLVNKSLSDYDENIDKVNELELVSENTILDNQNNEELNIEKESQRVMRKYEKRSVIFALTAGFVFWLIMVVMSLVS